MAYFSQASSPVTDFTKCVISCLVRAPALTTGFLEFGTVTRTSGFGVSGDGSMVVTLYGPDGSYSFTKGDAWSGYSAVCSFSTAVPVLSAGAWRRIIISLDVSGSASYSYTPPVDLDPGFYTLLNNDFRFWFSVGDTDYSPTEFARPALATPPIDSHTGVKGSFMPTFSEGDFALPGIEANGDITLPSFSIKINRLEFSIPCLAANAAPSYNRQFQIADFLMWTGVKLDTSVTANRRLFIDARGNAVAPSVSIATLGTPKYNFSGNAVAFLTNQGSADNPVKVGSITDFTP